MDGRLDDAAWQAPATFQLAYETRPRENQPPEVETQGWVAYDGDHLYVAFKALDPRPREIRARLTDRDRAFQDDFVGVVLDTFSDGNRAFEFFVNPLGVQMDLTQNDVTGLEDESWDAIWKSAGLVTEEGYVVEMALPFSSLRFPATTGEQTWGIDAVRIRPRGQRQRIGLHPMDRSVNCYLCQESYLAGLEGLEPGRNLEFDPTATGARTDRRAEAGDSIAEGDLESELGLTARWGVTPNLTLNAALNPDFSQVEADAAQLDVNTQFALFFPEKRPFFLEGADYFDTRLRAINSRNIADPSWGAKLTGKVGAAALGGIVAQDRITNLLIPGSQTSELTSLDSENTSTVLRYRRDLWPGSTMGVLYTGREGDDYHNRMAGFDTLLRWHDTEAVRIEVLGSQTRYPDAVADEFAQRHGSFDDWAVRAVYQHSQREWTALAQYEEIGEGFRADLGFIPQADYRKLYTMGQRFYHPEGSKWTRWSWGGELKDVQDHPGNRLERKGEVFAWAEGPRASFSEVGVGSGTRFFNGQDFDDDYVRFYFEAQPVASFYGFLDGRVGDTVDFANTRQAEELRLAPGVRFDLGRHLRLNLDHSYQTLDVDAGRLFTANLSELRATYQFNVRAFVRLITQYLQVDRQAELFASQVEPETKQLFNQLLFSYKINPQTVLFLGYSDHFLGDQRLELEQTDRTLFLKLGYALLL